MVSFGRAIATSFLCFATIKQNNKNITNNSKGKNNNSMKDNNSNLVVPVAMTTTSIMATTTNDESEAATAAAAVQHNHEQLSPEEEPLAKKAKRLETLSSTVSDVTTTATVSSTGAAAELEDYARSLEDRAKHGLPLTQEELDRLVRSIENLITAVPSTGTTTTTTKKNDFNDNIDLQAFREFLKDAAHLSHKDWSVTDRNGSRLGSILFPESSSSSNNGGDFSSSSSSRTTRRLLHRICKEGNWDGAVRHASVSSEAEAAPSWAVLVTGVNGIRKTTSLYQPWFPTVLQEALVVPSSASQAGNSDNNLCKDNNAWQLPSGQNSFFRQLDHMIATLCNHDFAELYRLTAGLLREQGDDDDDGSSTTTIPSKDVITAYTQLKAALFTRYRTVSELLGAALIRQSQRQSLNCMMETSGRDVAMFHYIDHFFDDTAATAALNKNKYRKLALHFQINDLTLAKQSVDARMVQEIQTGVQAISSSSVSSSPKKQGGDDDDDDETTDSVLKVIYTNAGGPYGSHVLDGIQRESEHVWNTMIMKHTSDDEDDSTTDSTTSFSDWYKATIQINAYADRPWTAQAVRPDGSFGTVFEFARPVAAAANNNNKK